MEVLREALSFGSRAWVGNLAAIANNRLDQLLMIPLVSPRQLGLYVIAFTIGNFTSAGVGALSSAVSPRVSRGDIDLLKRGLRLTLWGVALLHLLIAIPLPWLIPLIFGDAFAPAVPMAWLLLLAGVPGAGGFVLGMGLASAGHPTVSSITESIALVVTVVGLILLLPPLAGIGAGIVSVAAYSASFAVMLVFAGRMLNVSRLSLVIPTRGDVRWLRETSAGLLRRFR
jgi:O-antigen/teichoic acid export membrane protein